MKPAIWWSVRLRKAPREVSQMAGMTFVQVSVDAPGCGKFRITEGVWASQGRFFMNEREANTLGLPGAEITAFVTHWKLIYADSIPQLARAELAFLRRWALTNFGGGQYAIARAMKHGYGEPVRRVGK